MKRFLTIICIASLTMAGYAQNDSESFDTWTKSINKDFEDFRAKINKDFVEFVRNPWKKSDSKRPVPKPKDKPVPPVVAPIKDRDKAIESKPIKIDENIVKPQPVSPQPKPVQPIEQAPVDNENWVPYSIYGTSMKVRNGSKQKIHLASTANNAIADALTVLMNDKTNDNLIYDCLQNRQKYNLSDWAYLNMLKAVSEKIYGVGTNEATLLMAYIYMQSGYKMRVAEMDGKLYMLFASKNAIYDKISYVIDGNNYFGLEKLPATLNVCTAKFPKEQSLSLIVSKAQKFAMKETPDRTVSSERYKDLSVTCKVNKNVLDFYSTYPSSFYNDNFMTRWAIYANTPMQDIVKQTLYPQLRSILSGKSQLEAVNMLLNWVQTGFKYEYDDKVWGHDRAFFAEETLYYPYCDCEDRSILFTRLVRDLLGLKCILIYYPGHLASAVGFTDSVNGDYIELNGKRYVLADPTYIGAPVGYTMPDMDNQTAKVILLQ